MRLPAASASPCLRSRDDGREPADHRRLSVARGARADRVPPVEHEADAANLTRFVEPMCPPTRKRRPPPNFEKGRSLRLPRQSRHAILPLRRYGGCGRALARPVHDDGERGAGRAVSRHRQPMRLQAIWRSRWRISSQADSGIVGSETGAMMEPAPVASYHDQGRDNFETIETNPLKVTAEEPVSTFSIDVDTSSYSFIAARRSTTACCRRTIRFASRS